MLVNALVHSLLGLDDHAVAALRQGLDDHLVEVELALDATSKKSNVNSLVPSAYFNSKLSSEGKSVG